MTSITLGRDRIVTMGIPAHTARVVISGTAPGGEIFETGFWLFGTGWDTRVEIQNLADAVAASWQTTARLPLCALISHDTEYTNCKVYYYRAGGPTATFVGERALTSGLGSGPGQIPLYTCMVATLRTGISGRSYKGRMYLPAAGVSLDTDHRFPASKASDACDGLAAWFNAINAFAAPLESTVSVVSQFLTAHNDVNEVSIDSKPDVQRRRENKMPGGVVATHLVTP